MKTKLLMAIAVIGLVVAGLYYTGQLDQAPQSRAAAPSGEAPKSNQTTDGAVLPPAVTVARVQEEQFIETVMVTGTLVPRDEILVAPEVEGLRVLELKVDEGDVVKKGDVLATLVATTLQAQVAQSDASLARSDAAIARAESVIAESEARVKEADASLERAKPLTKSGYLSESSFDTREATAKTMRAQLVAARDGLKLAQAEKGQVVAQRKELDWRLSNTDVKSPADGIISRRTARVGALAMSVSEPMFRIVARGEIELDAEVPEAPLAKVKINQKANVEVAGVGPVPGTVRLVSPEVDKATRLGRVRVFLGADPRIRIGAFGRGVIQTAEARGLAVPASSVLYDERGATVLIVRDGKVAEKQVQTGLMADGKVEIRSGVARDDIVVARAGTFLRDGDAVRPITPGETVSTVVPGSSQSAPVPTP